MVALVTVQLAIFKIILLSLAQYATVHAPNAYPQPQIAFNAIPTFICLTTHAYLHARPSTTPILPVWSVNPVLEVAMNVLITLFV